MNTKLGLDKTNRIEVGFTKPSPKIRDMAKLDTVLSSMRSPALVVSPMLLGDINMIRFQRNSQYKVIVSIDPEGKVFGSTKIHQIRECTDADGYEIGLAQGKNQKELLNEIISINNVFVMSGARYFIRWVINAKHGTDHIKNCLAAIKEAKAKNINYEMITIMHDGADAEVLHSLVQSARKSVGIAKELIKIKSKFNEDLIVHDKNLLYEFEAEELV